jgi:excisionase family DNA binding protein
MFTRLPDFKIDENFVFLTVREAAEIARVSPSTVRNWLRRSQLRSHNYGRVIRIAKTDLVEFISQCSSESKAG